MELDPGGRTPQLVQHADFGGHQYVARSSRSGRIEHAAGGQDPHPVGGHRTRTRQVQGTGRAATFRVDVELGVGSGRNLRGQLGAVDPGMHVALAGPDVQVRPAGDPLHVRAEELIGQEQHLPVRGDRVHHLDGVG